jgi:hypothetical protein
MKMQRVTRSDGWVEFMPLGQVQPDTPDTLERDGLIRFKRKPGRGMKVTFLDPDHPRVLCWALSFNLNCREAGLGELFPDLPLAPCAEKF